MRLIFLIEGIDDDDEDCRGLLRGFADLGRFALRLRPADDSCGRPCFVDDEHCDIDGMIAFLRTYKGKTTTSCPNTECWLKAFGDADTVYCVTISSAMSGTYNAAMLAAKEYMELHPERRVHVFDSLSAGPGCTQMVEKVADCVRKGLSFEDTVAAVTAFRDRANLIFRSRRCTISSRTVA